MNKIAVIIFLHSLSEVISSEHNKSLPTLNIQYKKFKENEYFDVEEYGNDIYLEGCTGIIHEETFVDVPKISRFMVYKSNFTSFDLTSLCRLANLESLDLINVVGLPVLSNKIMLGFKHLRRLSMHHTDIKFEHDSFQKLSSLEYLSISKSDVTILGNYIFTGSRIKELYWTDSGIKKIDKHCFSPLADVEIINLSGNKIEVFAPETFQRLQNLERLYLNRNQLTTINFKYLELSPSLKYLDISLNNIRGLRTSEISKILPNLTTIVLDEKSVLSETDKHDALGFSLRIVAV